MIILDTNVISEPIKTRPDLNVISWLDRQSAEEIYLCAPVVAELRYGASKLPNSRRKSELGIRIDKLAIEPFQGRVLPFDFSAAEIFGPMVADRERRGRPIQTMDAMIAAIALDHGAQVATRNISHFDLPGIDLINPFEI